MQGMMLTPAYPTFNVRNSLLELTMQSTCSSMKSSKPCSHSLHPVNLKQCNAIHSCQLLFQNLIERLSKKYLKAKRPDISISNGSCQATTHFKLWSISIYCLNTRSPTPSFCFDCKLWSTVPNYKLQVNKTNFILILSSWTTNFRLAFHILDHMFSGQCEQWSKSINISICRI
jgi:hypothetical protein